MVDWESFLSTEAKLRVKHAMKRPLPRGSLKMSISAPHIKNFPMKGLSVTFQTPQSDFKELKTVSKDPVDGVADPEIIEISQGVNSSGIDSFGKWVKDYINKFHKPTFDWDLVIQGGSTHSLDSILRTLMNQNEDTMLADEFTYTGVLNTCRPMRIKIFPVKLTKEGVDTIDLDRILTNWEIDHPGVKKPKAYYAMPTGHNPTGLTLPLKNRKDLIEVCKKHNILIIEDDVFYHLDFGMKSPPSLLELDKEGRVLRIDSFSKVLMPGLRISLVTCNPIFQEKLIILNDHSIGAASPPSQLLLATILQEWGPKGFDEWCSHLNDDYRSKRNNMISTLDSIMPQHLMDYSRPESGMIVWFSLKSEAWPEQKDNWFVYLEDLIFEKTIEKGVAVGKGHWFMVDPTTELAAWRSTYSFLDLGQMKRAVQIFADVIKETHEELYS